MAGESTQRMASEDLGRAKNAYERARFMRAISGTIPFSLVVAFAMIFGTRREIGLPLGVALLGLAAFSLHRGGLFGRAVLPGIVAGIFPLLLAFAARACGHVCMGDSCMSLCVPACSMGGLVAGAGLAWLGLRTKMAPTFFVAAFGFTLLTGALGCSCVGSAGVLGLFAGLVVPLLPALGIRRHA